MADRNRIRMLAMASALLVAAACGSDDDSSSGSVVTTSEPVAEDAGSVTVTENVGADGSEAAYPRTVEHAIGTLTLNARPERIYSTFSNEQFDVPLALGVIPVGVSGFAERGLFPWQIEAGGDQAEFVPRSGDQVNAEVVARLEPDLIITTEDEFLDGDDDALEGIAPILVIPRGGLDLFETQLEIVADALGLGDEAVAEVLGDIDDVFEIDVPAVESVAAILPFGAGEQELITVGGSANDIVERLGLPPLYGPELGLDGGDFGFAPVSEELLAEIDADVMIGIALDSEALAAFAEGPLFESIPAVEDGDYAPLDLAFSRGFIAPSVLNIDEVVEAFVAALTEAAA